MFLHALVFISTWRYSCLAWFSSSADSDGSDSNPIPNTAQSLEALVSDLQTEVQSLRLEHKELRRRLDGCACSHSADLRNGEDEDAQVDIEASANIDAEIDQKASDETGGIVNIDVGNTDWLKEVLFGGRPWVIYCDDKSDKKRLPPPAVFQESAVQLKGMATFGTLDCWERTASGKTVAHRFDFPGPPVMFAVANGDAPKVVDLEGLAKPWQLRRKVQSHLVASVTRIDKTETFKSVCSSRRACLIIGFKTAPMLADTLGLIQPLLDEHRGVRAVSVDTSVWKIKLDAKMATTKPKKKEGEKERSNMLCIARSSGKQSRGAFFRYTGEAAPTAEDVEVFLDRCATGKNLVPMSATPQISLRPPDQPKGYYPPPSSTASSTPSGKSESSKAKGKGKAQPTKTARRPIPRYSSSSGQRSRASPKSGKTNRKQDHFGSRDSLEQSQEPLFTTVEDGSDDTDDMQEDDSSNDEAEEEVEL